jgi:hypothetical protein
MKDIQGYEGLYAVTTCGKVWSYISNKWLKSYDDRVGYLQVSLRKEGRTKKFRIHRLVLLTYVPNPLNLPTVNHINGVKTDNYLNNLEWLSYTENNVHAMTSGLRLNTFIPRGVVQVDIETGKYIALHETVADAIFSVQGCRKSPSITRCCRGKQKTAYGYKWCYTSYPVNP